MSGIGLFTRLEHERGVARLFNEDNRLYTTVVQLLLISQATCFATVDSP